MAYSGRVKHMENIIEVPETNRLGKAIAFAKQWRPKKPIPGAFIYLISCREFVKAGIAKNPKGRLGNLQIGSPFDLKLLKTFMTITPRWDERRLHFLWKDYEVRGEWFKVKQEELERVLKCQTFEEIFKLPLP